MAILLVIGFVWVMRLNGRLKELRKQYLEVMGNTGVDNLEDVIGDMKRRIDEQQQYTEKLEEKVAEMSKLLPKLKSKVGTVRYNAFSDGGNDLSFSIAIVSEEKDGVVFSGLHSRDSTYVYAKPVEQGASSYPLTPEERSAIDKAK
ncbi:DUF4446 family protein [Paenibacillus sp. HB172176]|uniref:DUF4446 family protein n=1 Tax=Paenibacillus sp. HB172176 TaxID=2493690 RepID=UPI001F0CEDC0|nr:DUF4446 family protein [Paenibacillus sp. HB172176]